MKRFLLIVTIFFLLVIGGFYLININSNHTVVKNKPVTLSDQVKKNGGQLVDVREPSEYVINHAEGAINVPVGNILKGDFTKIDSKKPIYVYCRTGKRAGQAKIALEKAGYKKVTNLGGLVCKTSQSSC